MSDEEFEASAQEPAPLPESDTHPIALPAFTPPPVTPPPLDATETTAPTASYALGALTGNPHLGPPPGSSYQGPPPTTATCGRPRRPQPGPPRPAPRLATTARPR